ncbi:hypothetical protein [Methylocapsa acidiphila]|uniref:hypothetical protein n=1 Tax=Methylocapsa acidiphila TaxID=133552 RepID=UPI00041B3A2D|nr:hypothetical protein [Methylocapsa acidiphila]
MTAPRGRRATLIFLTASTALVAAAIALGLWMAPRSARRILDQDTGRVSVLTGVARAALPYGGRGAE